LSVWRSSNWRVRLTERTGCGGEAGVVLITWQLSLGRQTPSQHSGVQKLGQTGGTAASGYGRTDEYPRCELICLAARLKTSKPPLGLA